MARRRAKNKIVFSSNAGTTLIEMLVCFMMLAIFLTAAFSVISHISKQYYQVKGETYGKQVSDILLLKIQSELEGAKSGADEILIDNDSSKVAGNAMTFYDRTNTLVELSVVDNYFQVKYFKVEDSTDPSKNRNENIWKYDENVYNSFYIKDLKFIRADSLTEADKTLAKSYGANIGDGEYNNDIMLVLLDIDSHHYGEYKTFRFIKMYNVEENSGGGTPIGG